MPKYKNKNATLDARYSLYIDVVYQIKDTYRRDTEGPYWFALRLLGYKQPKGSDCVFVDILFTVLDRLDDAGLQWLETLANTDNFHTLVTAFCIRHKIKLPKLHKDDTHA